MNKMNAFHLKYNFGVERLSQIGDRLAHIMNNVETELECTFRDL